MCKIMPIFGKSKEEMHASDALAVMAGLVPAIHVTTLHRA
jgi:hypothetical protein